MNGIVNAELELTVDLLIRGPSGETQLTAIIDTGYNGLLSLPFRTIAALGLPRLTSRSVTLSDGSRRMAAFYEAEVEWDGQFNRVQVLCISGDPLIGTALLKGFKMEIDFIVGALVRITRV